MRTQTAPPLIPWTGTRLDQHHGVRGSLSARKGIEQLYSDHYIQQGVNLKAKYRL